MAEFYTRRQQGGYVPVIMETPDHIVIEGIPHDKNTLNPVFLKSLEFNNTNNLVPIIMNRFWIRYSFKTQVNELMRDFYCDPSSVKADGGGQIAKQVWNSEVSPGEFYVTAPLSNGRTLRIKRDTYQYLNNMTYTPKYTSGQRGDRSPVYPYASLQHYMFNETINRIDILDHKDETADSAIQSGYWYHYTAACERSRVWTLSKDIWDISNNVVYQSPSLIGNSQIVYQSELYTYIAFGNHTWWYTGDQRQYTIDSLNGKGRSYMVAIRRSDNASTVLVDVNNGDTAHTSQGPSYAKAMNPGDPNELTYFVTTPLATASFFNINKVKFNISSNTAISQAVQTVDYASAPEFGLNTTHKGLTVADARAIIPRNFVIDDNSGSYYLGLTITETTSGSAELIETFATYIFNVVDPVNSNTIIPTQRIQHDIRPREVFPLNKDWTRIIFIFDTYIAFYVWNTGSHTLEEVNRVSMDCRALGVDELDRIWTYDSNDKIYLMTPYVPTSVTVNYEFEDYNYQGTNINSYVNVSAYDAFNTRILSSIQLTIEGPNCTFEDGTQVKTITTSVSGETQVPIIVTNAGYFRILANTQV